MKDGAGPLTSPKARTGAQTLTFVTPYITAWRNWLKICRDHEIGQAARWLHFRRAFDGGELIVRAMAAILFALFIGLLPVQLHQCAQLPDSTSPDGKYFFVYQPPSFVPPGAPSKFWIVRRSDGSAASAQLVPTRDQTQARTEDEARRNGPAHTRQLMYNLIASAAEAEHGRGIRNGINYEVRWQADGRRVVISGGKSKFSHTATYVRRDGVFVLK